MRTPGIALTVPPHPTVVNALRQARSAAGARPVDTRDLLVALMRVDTSGSWDRISLHCGDDVGIAGKIVLDPATGGASQWEGIRLTDSCAAALETAARLAHRYNMHAIPTGMLALGLVADPDTAAARALSDGLSREQLLAAVQADVLGVTLSGLSRELRRPQAEPPRAAVPVPVPTARATYCRHCGATPAAAVDIRSHRGLLLWMQFVRMPGPFCRDCGLATLRRMTLQSVWLGWWGPLSLMINPITLLANASAHSRIRALGPPIPGMPGRPMDPGKPLFRRPAALGFLIPVAFLLWFWIALPLLSG
ncbi:hypothetical protein NN3_28200 [Nocardia neocaledoniensis NBRC 108232]|uniref:Uncharacterized protein n=1 Tax=Nocardia neocaledoniensis TaxID=236511 RepID=A0A317NIZ0_9NOCA|nr:hypothetical protein [Nocardia neocaledoniensis]PWV75090.1 hypothetical protein DFR69_105164 [Nocardia neocaledoniensis]GEM31813.1 hypothetical protein NN3_28200 [Nocardia neocaledoniensis NBRC 108232]